MKTNTDSGNANFFRLIGKELIELVPTHPTVAEIVGKSQDHFHLDEKIYFEERLILTDSTGSSLVIFERIEKQHNNVAKCTFLKNFSHLTSSALISDATYVGTLKWGINTKFVVDQHNVTPDVMNCLVEAGWIINKTLL